MSNHHYHDIEHRLDELDNEDQASTAPLASKPLKRKWLVLVVALLVSSGGAFGAWSFYQSQGKASASETAANANSGNSRKPYDVVAKVNGLPVTESEIQGVVETGVDRAIVVDRYINKVLAAERGRELYGKEASAVLKAAEREVLASLYTSKRMEELRSKVSDEEVKSYYSKNVLDENFKLWKVSYYLSADANDINKVLASMKQGDSSALNQLKPLVEQGDGYAATLALPYGLGRVVSKMSKGGFSDPLPLRNGYLVLRLDDMKQLNKPKLDDVKQEIVQAIALQRFNEELEKSRREAKVELI